MPIKLIDNGCSNYTWYDSLVTFPIVFAFWVPLYFMNALSGPNGFGYQKLIPQLMIPEEKRINEHPRFIESIFY